MWSATAKNLAAMLKIQMLEQIVTRDSVAEEQQDGSQQLADGYVQTIFLSILFVCVCRKISVDS